MLAGGTLVVGLLVAVTLTALLTATTAGWPMLLGTWVLLGMAG
ncbi:hypothetical protein ACI2K6_16170 [Microbacterium sp. NPDC006705]|nr:hypothetical protein [Microbacterium plantarum]WRK17139.1 hypothetical protein VC184_14725 [Microbacterium plantarum]